MSCRKKSLINLEGSVEDWSGPYASLTTAKCSSDVPEHMGMTLVASSIFRAREEPQSWA